MKRTSLILEDGIMDAIRDKAHREHREMTAIVNELLLEGLQKSSTANFRVIKLPEFSMGRPKANLADRDALENLMEGQ